VNQESKDILLVKVKKCYEENFKLNGLWNHYIIDIDNQSDDVLVSTIVHELWNNGVFTARTHYVNVVRKQLEKNKTVTDWQDWAKEFTYNFTKEGYVILHNKECTSKNNKECNCEAREKQVKQ